MKSPNGGGIPMEYFLRAFACLGLVLTVGACTEPTPGEDLEYLRSQVDYLDLRMAARATGREVTGKRA